MNYVRADVMHLMRNMSFVSLMRPGSALELLRRQIHKITEWHEFVPLYCSVRCEPLDFFYTYLQCLGALDRCLLEDLLTGYTWRGVVRGSWLAALAPQTNFRDVLIKARPHVPHNQWIVDLALAVLDHEQPQELIEHLDLLAQLREALAPLPKPLIRLRHLDPLQIRNLKDDHPIILDIYRSKGSEAARAYMAGRPWWSTYRRCEDIRHCVIDDGTGDGLGPSRDVWVWGYTLLNPHSPDEVVILSALEAGLV